MLSLKEHKDPRLFRVGEMRDHAYFIPFTRKGDLTKSRKNSPLFINLNNSWEFTYYSSYTKIDERLIASREISDTRMIDLPECWQTRGVDFAQYQHSPYQFIFDPPHVPESNPCAVYRRLVSIELEEGIRYDLLYSKAWLEKAKQNDIVVVCLGTNDVNSGTYLDADRSTEEIYADILAICQELESAGCEIILLSTPPFGYSSDEKNQTCLELREYLSELAEDRGYDFIDTVALWGKSDDMATSKYPASSSDYHPNSLGCEVLAQAFVNRGIIEPALPDIDSDFPFVKDEDEEYGQNPIVRPRPGDIIK